MHQGMLNGGAIIGILPQQGRIGSMQSCEEARCEASQHLRCQTRRQSMWYRIMNMKKIELLRARHFRHFHCKGQSVVRARKQRVVHDFDSMEMKTLLRQGQSNGLRITEKVKFIAPPPPPPPQNRPPKPPPPHHPKTPP